MIAYKFFCRTIQFFFNIGLKLIKFRQPVCINEEGGLICCAEILAKCGKSNPLIVMGNGTFRRSVALPLTQELEKCGMKYAIYHGVKANPSIETAEEIRALFLKNGNDSFIALGGGSPMDAAKAAAAGIARSEKSIKKLKGYFKIRREIPLFIAIPTTAGTGSETTIAAVVTDTKTHHKYAIADTALIPHYAVLDPTLTFSLPADITAQTGMDALTHAIEAYLCVSYTTEQTNEMSKISARLIMQNLEKAYSNGNDLSARAALLEASFLAGKAFTRSGVGNVHAAAHSLSGFYDTPHGLANAVLLPVVLSDCFESVYKKLSELFLTCGYPDTADERKNAASFIARIKEMNVNMDITENFDFIRAEDIPQMAAYAVKEANPFYPVPVIYSKARFEKIYKKISG